MTGVVATVLTSRESQEKMSGKLTGADKMPQMVEIVSQSVKLSQRAIVCDRIYLGQCVLSCELLLPGDEISGAQDL